MQSLTKYKERHGYFPAEVMGDRFYCNRENRRMLKELGICLLGKPLGRPSEKNRVTFDLGDRNPIEGKYGQAKVKYGMDRIRARLKGTSESWVAMILVVMNLVRMVREAPYFWLRSAVAFLGKIVQRMVQEMQGWRLVESLGFGYRVQLIQ